MSETAVYKHNDIEGLERQLQRATSRAKENSSILVVTEGVFGMTGDLGKLREIVALKEKYNFRLLVDDAHGFGTLGHDGSGAGTELGCQDGIDIYFGTFAEAVAVIGAFVATEPRVEGDLSAKTRRQMFGTSLRCTSVASARERSKMT